MKIVKLKASGFGRFKNWESPDINKDIVVINGFNESGKTTIFKLISTIFYGWHPVLNNPYLPWDGTYAECEGHLKDKDGVQHIVYRRLRNRAEGKMITGEKIINLNNGAIKQLSNMPFEVFNEVYALTIDQMGFPDYVIWQRLQDQILGGQYMSFMQPVNSVISELQNEANSLWRPDRQGKPKDKLLQEKLKDLRLKLQEAEKNENQMRILEEKLYSLTQELEKVMSKKAGLTAIIDRFERLYPVKRKLEKIDELLNISKNIENYNFIPRNPGQVIKELEELKNSLEQELNRFISKKELFERKKGQYTAADEKIYSIREEIREITRSYNQLESDYRTLKDMENETSRFADRLQDRAKDFLQGGWRSELSDILSTIDEAELRAAIYAFKKNEIQYNQLHAKIEALKIRYAEKKSSRFMPVALLMILPVIVGIFLRNSASSVFFPVLSVIIFTCVFLIWWLLKSNSSMGIEIKEAQKSLNRINELRTSSLYNIKSVLKGLPIAAQRLDNPDESLLVDINTLKELLCNLNESARKKRLTINRLREKECIVKSLLQVCGISGEGNLLRDITRLEGCLDEAELHYRDYHDALYALEEIDRQISYIESRISDTNNEIQLIINGLDSMKGNNLSEKINNIEELRKAYDKALTLKEELEHDYPDLEDIVREINIVEQKGIIFVQDMDEIARIKTEREQMDMEINMLNEEIGSVKKELEQRQKNDRLDDIKGYMASIEEERKQTAFKRDRLILMKKIFQEADRVYREENQPDVLQKAGSYIAAISGGRYNQIFIKDDEQTGLMVKSNYMDYPLDIKQPLSRGTIEQIYFALRLALLDHLDSDGERLPFFSDEVLINWDEFRMEKGLELIKCIAQKRQVFLFTCHKEIADIIGSKGEAQIINL